MKERKDIPEKYKWDLSQYCKNFEDCETRLISLQKQMQKIKTYQGKLTEQNEDLIFECLKFESEIFQKLEILFVYSHLRLSENLTDSKAVELKDKVGNVCTEFGTITSFILVELGNLSTEFLEKLMKNAKFPQFFNTFKEIIRDKPHILSLKEEVLLSKVGNFSGGFSDSFDMLDSSDIKFKSVKDSKGKFHELNHSTYSKFTQSEDRVLRRNAYKNMNGAYGEYNNTISQLFINSIKKRYFYSEVKNFSSSMEASMFYEEVSDKVYNTLIKSVNKNLDLAYEIYETKRKLLGLKQIGNYDMNATVNSKFDLKITYEQSIELLKKALKPLGENYVSLLEKAKNERWIDVFDNVGKDTGQFSWAAYGANPIVFLRYNDSFDSLSTTAHELGHCFHSYFSDKNQPYENAQYAVFVAEVASQVNEVLLLFYLIETAKNKQEKICYYEKFFNQFRDSVIRQTMFAEFEKFAHDEYQKTKALSKDILNDKYFELNQKYFGNKVEILLETKFEWSRVPHFYKSFYVYKYSTGLISAIQIAHKIYNNEPNARENYLKFLSSGSTLPPVELLKITGVDLENEKTFDEVFAYIKSLLVDFKKLN